MYRTKSGGVDFAELRQGGEKTLTVARGGKIAHTVSIETIE
jgi:hypothetical protein